MSKLSEFIHQTFDNQDWISILQAINNLIISAQRAQNAKNVTPLVAEAHRANELNLKALEAKVAKLAETHKAEAVALAAPNAKSK